MTGRPRKPLVVKGAREWTPADAEWSRQALTQQMSALPTLRASAERWATGLTTLLAGGGLVSVLLGPEKFERLASPYEGVAKGLFFAAAAAAAIAAAAALTASTSASRRVFLVTGPTIRTASREAVRSTLVRLSISRWSAGAAVLLVFGAGAIAFFSPADPAASTPGRAIPARALPSGP